MSESISGPSWGPTLRHRLRRVRDRRFLTWAWIIALAGFGVWAFLHQRQAIEDTIHRLANADPTWLAIAVGIEICAIFSVAFTYKVILKRLGHDLGTPYLAWVQMQQTGINFAAPLGGVVTAWMFARLTARKGVPLSDALLTLFLRTTCVWGATVVVLVAAAALEGTGQAEGIALVATGIATLVFLVMLRSWWQDWQGVVSTAGRLPNRVQGRASDLAGRFQSHNLSPFDLLLPIATTVGTRICTISLIYACTRALGEHPSAATVFLAYLASFIAARLVPALNGLGAVEGAMAVALHRGGVPVEVGVGVALLVRFYDLFVPALIGLLFTAIDSRRHGDDRPGGEAGAALT